MKKTLLFAMALAATVSANADDLKVAICAFNAEDNEIFAATGVTSNGAILENNTKIGEAKYGDELLVEAYIGAGGTYKSSSIGTFLFDVTSASGDGLELASLSGLGINGGIQEANNNPKDEDGGTPSTTFKAPVSGGYFVFDVHADGYLYVVHKANSSKPYTVFENGNCLAYTFAAADEGALLGYENNVYNYTILSDSEYGYITTAGFTTDKGVTYTSMPLPEQIAAGWDGTSEWTKVGAGGLSVIKFPVYKDCKYIVNANGSKMTASGFLFETTGKANAYYTKTNETTGVETTYNLLTNGKPTGISEVNEAAKQSVNNGKTYNLAGQEVDSNYSGVVIKDGKKSIQ